MSDPKLGMRYEEARKKALHFARLKNVKDEGNRHRIIGSILNQARLCDGEKAQKEIAKEILKDVYRQ